ncbi:glutathione S-transferase A-like isoform X3 [Sycon ciliatum]|uniref:glutathione S-transferase A-like isoform X3 n=1 Tax=Sycon ciliatum TaxID=27933 RepID=UPI0031F65AC2
MGKEDMFLLWGSGSSPCMRVMIALEEKGFSGYAQKKLDFSKGEHKGPEVLALNPRGQVPTFKDGDLVLGESYAVLHYLQHRYPDSGNNLLPGSAKEQGKALQRYYEEEVQKKVDAFLKEMKTFDGYLAESKFVGGDSFSLGDIDMMVILTMCERQALNVKEKFPNMHAYYERNKERPSIAASYPPHFKTSDSPKILASF